MLQKADNQKVKDFIIRVTAQELEVDESIVETIISDAYKTANHACRTHNEVELAGFGVMLVSKAKVRRKLSHYSTALANKQKQLETEADEERRKILTDKVLIIKGIIEELNRRAI